LPNNLELTAIYFKEDFIAIVVYSAEGNKDYKTAELGIEICGSEAKTLDQIESMIRNPLFETAREINGWPVLINKMTYSNIQEFRQKYGDFTLSGRVWIDGYRYIIVAPTLTTDELVQLIGNMELIATINCTNCKDEKGYSCELLDVSSLLNAKNKNSKPGQTSEYIKC
jgi:hypothetical protein